MAVDVRTDGVLGGLWEVCGRFVGGLWEVCGRFVRGYTGVNIIFQRK